MARTKTVTVENDDEADDALEAATPDEDASPFMKLLQELNGNGGGSKMDPTMMLIMKMQEDARREEKESRRHMLTLMITLVTPVLPVLVEKIFGQKSNPMLETLLKGIMEKGNGTDLMKEMMGFMMTGNQAMLNNMVQQLSTVSAVKDKIHEDSLEAIRRKQEDMDGDSKPNESPLVSGLREARLLMEAVGINRKAGGTPNLNGGLVPESIPANTAQPTPNLAAPTAPETPANSGATTKAAPIAILIRTLYSLNTRGNEMTPKQRAGIRSRLAVAVQDDEVLTQAIIDGDSAKLTELGLSVVTADPAMMTWIQTPGVSDWITDYIGKQLGPILDEIVNAEELAKEDDTPETTGEDKAPE